MSGFLQNKAFHWVNIEQTLLGPTGSPGVILWDLLWPRCPSQLVAPARLSTMTEVRTLKASFYSEDPE